MHGQQFKFVLNRHSATSKSTQDECMFDHKKVFLMTANNVSIRVDNSATSAE